MFAYQRASAGQTTGQVIGGTVADIFGVTGAVTNDLGAALMAVQ